MISNTAVYWAVTDFVVGFAIVGAAIKLRDRLISILLWGLAGLNLIAGILQLMGRLPLT